MSTQFKNSNLSYYLYSAIVVIIGAASVFVFWYMFNGFKAGTYTENTLLGSVYLGGLEESEVSGKMTKRIDDWLLDDKNVFEITYQGYSYEFDRELLDFNIDQSINNINNGVTNELIVNYSEDNEAFVLNEISEEIFLDGIYDDFDFDSIIEKILIDASYMKSFSSSELEDYLIDAESSFDLIHENVVETPLLLDVNNFVRKIETNFTDGKVVVNSQTLFSVLDTFGEEFSNDEMTVIASGILENIKYSNFVIHENHYLSEINYNIYDVSTYPYFGKQASVSASLDDDFRFYNPNDGYYEFTFSIVSANEIKVTFTGLEFIDQIIVTESPAIAVAFVSTPTEVDTAVRDGIDGRIIEVRRRIINAYGDELIEGVIVYEFYKAVTEIYYEEG